MGSEQIPDNHPNPDLSNLLMKAAQEDRLTPELIQQTLGLSIIPNVERDATAYVNWSTTAVVEGPAPAQVWFAGAGYDRGISYSPDKIRDTRNIGNCYWWSNNPAIRTHPDVECCFWVKQLNGKLFIDIYMPNVGTVGIFAGKNYDGSFYGKGLWGFVDSLRRK
ncbi:hypothetical protein PILCRDRAFT_821593 [Piloderma croceum F 1598]|uniref:Uncharacterized protein n=1 Tax=Piloderma croceum (strain F 1598) TaxID=765440 RepID=A0A0C3FPP9_PILCF|nr:hypothetical protein PILCRDRAFT_821593 [Piloderma croceum F 1598]